MSAKNMVRAKIRRGRLLHFENDIEHQIPVDINAPLRRAYTKNFGAAKSGRTYPSYRRNMGSFEQIFE